MQRKFVDPTDFKDDDLPIIVLCDDRRGFVGWAIRNHTSGNYNHAMIMHKLGEVVSQDFVGFREKPIAAYMNSSQFLKFWVLKDMSNYEQISVLAAIQRRLALPWWRRSYDFVGTFLGQFLRLRFLQSPWQEYCSEQVKHDYLDQIERLKNIQFGRPSPADLDRIFKQYPDVFEAVGYWWHD